MTLSNPRRSDLAPLTVTALVDTGAITLCIPEHVAVQLNLSALEQREVTTAEGRHVSVPYVGPVQVTFGNRSCFVGALVLGDGVLLGSIPLEDMDLVINSRRQEVTVNPESPNIPSAVVKSASCRTGGREVPRIQPLRSTPSGGASAHALVRPGGSE
ncbi:MAG: clan AA aspartic protease [Acidobacteria bacterium]|nr:clan AA aspartic protease [Acidobacteriota bacterium]